jgi:hypothetical protein
MCAAALRFLGALYVYTTTVGVVSVCSFQLWIGSLLFFFLSLFRLDVLVFVLENEKLLVLCAVVRSCVFYGGDVNAQRRGQAVVNRRGELSFIYLLLSAISSSSISSR